LETLQGMPVEAQPANSHGEFEFTDLRKESYRLTVSAEGFQTLERDVDLRFTTSRVVVNLFLTPVGQSKSVQSAPAVLTDQLAPKKARDELVKGDRALSKEKYSDARTHLEKAIAEYPCYARAQTDLAIALIQLLALTQAESALRKSIKCDPGYHQARLVLGQLLNMQKRFEESEKVLTEAVRLAPGSWQLYYRLGVADFGLGEYARAAEEYEKVLSFNPTPPSDYYVKAADAYLAQEAYDKAYAKMQDYLRIDPDGRFAGKIRRTVQQMEADGVLSKSMESAAQTKKP
jgi:tetratricopeptide (TPR) repeat protein